MRMTWEEILQKYPNQYVALTDIILVGDEVQSAEVACGYPYTPKLKFNFRGAFSPFWTGDLKECPALHLPGVKEIKLSGRLSWENIKRLYPNQGIGLINVVYKNQDCPINPSSGCVLITKADWSSIQLYGACGYVTFEVTGEDNIYHSGELSVIGPIM